MSARNIDNGRSYVSHKTTHEPCNLAAFTSVTFPVNVHAYDLCVCHCDRPRTIAIVSRHVTTDLYLNTSAALVFFTGNSVI